MDDPEIDAMQKVSGALSGLEESARARVLQWAAAKFNIAGNQQPQGVSQKAEDARGEEFRDFADLFYAADPQTHAEKALVAAFWLTANAGESFPSQAINSLLKDLGFQLANITDALSQNMKEKPALVVQVRKSGNTKQARKLYKVTDAGTKRVNLMIKNNQTKED